MARIHKFTCNTIALPERCSGKLKSTYHTDEQQELRQDCVSVQSRQSLWPLQTLFLEQEKAADKEPFVWNYWWDVNTFEPLQEKTNKMICAPSKDSDQPGPVWSECSLCALWLAKDPMFLFADSEYSDKTGWMPRLIWVFDWRTSILLLLSCSGSFVRDH